MRQLDEQLRSLVEEAAQRKAAKAIENGELCFLQNFKVEFLLIDHFLCSQEQACPQVNGGWDPRRSWGPGRRRQERWRNLNTGAGGVQIKFQRERQTRKRQHPCHRSLASQLTGKQRIFRQQKGIVAEPTDVISELWCLNLRHDPNCSGYSYPKNLGFLYQNPEFFG